MDLGVGENAGLVGTFVNKNNWDHCGYILQIAFLD
jgi:hypothetical protein